MAQKSKRIRRQVLLLMAFVCAIWVFVLLVVNIYPRVFIGSMQQVQLCADHLKTYPPVIADVGRINSVACVYTLCETRLQVTTAGGTAYAERVGEFVYDVYGDIGSRRYSVSWRGESGNFVVDDVHPIRKLYSE